MIPAAGGLISIEIAHARMSKRKAPNTEVEGKKKLDLVEKAERLSVDRS